MNKSEALFAIAAHTTCATLMVLLNKAVMNSMNVHFEFLVLFAQNFFTPFAVILMRKLKMIPYFPIEISGVLKFTLLSLLQICYMSTSLFCLRHVSVPVYTIVKSAAPVFIAISNSAIFDTPLTTKMVIALALLSFGTALSYSEGWATLIGILWLLIHMSSNVAHVVYQHTFKNTPKWASTFYNACNCMPLSLFAALFFGEFDVVYSNWDSIWANRVFMICLPFSIAVGTLIMFTSFWLNYTTSATTYSVVGSVMKVPIVVVSLLVFDDNHANPKMWIGLLIVIGATILYGAVGKLDHVEERGWRRKLKLAVIASVVISVATILNRSTRIPDELNGCEMTDTAWGEHQRVDFVVTVPETSSIETRAANAQQSITKCFGYRLQAAVLSPRPSLLTDPVCKRVPNGCVTTPSPESQWVMAVSNISHTSDWFIAVSPGLEFTSQALYDIALHMKMKGCHFATAGLTVPVEPSLAMSVLQPWAIASFGHNITDNFRSMSPKMITIPSIIAMSREFHEAFKVNSPSLSYDLVKGVNEDIEIGLRLDHIVHHTIQKPKVCTLHNTLNIRDGTWEETRVRSHIRKAHCIGEGNTMSEPLLEDSPRLIEVYRAFHGKCPGVSLSSVRLSPITSIVMCHDAGVLLTFVFIPIGVGLIALSRQKGKEHYSGMGAV